MPRYVALFRAALEASGRRQVRALLSGGNAVFESGVRRGSAIERDLDATVDRKFGLATEVVVGSASEWRAIVDEDPFPLDAREDPGHLAVMPLKARPAGTGIDALRAAIPGRERAQAQGRDLYLVYPDGIGRSKLASALIERRLGVSGTGRNWHTVQELVALVEESPVRPGSAWGGRVRQRVVAPRAWTL